jgi:TRAP-type mannitol/chloroaromatic compound transport system substrate-binding protein
MTRSRWSFSAVAFAAATLLASGIALAQAPKTVKIRVQSVIPTSADEVTMLKEFAADVAALTNNTVTFEVLPAGAVVAVNDTLDAVDKGLIEGGFAWTHYWSGKHPAAALFGSPAAGSGVGMDNFAWVSWFLYGGGKELYDDLWKEMKVNVKGFILQPVGPEALGWFKKPINSMADFRKLRFRTPPGIPGQIYNDIGVASVAMGGGDILPGLEKGVIDAAEWCCPKPDMTFGFQKVLKHYYLEGLHQVVVNADLYINGDVWKSLSPGQQKAIEVSANASLMKTVAYRITENGKALKELTEKHGVILHDTPKEYFTEYGAAAMKNFQKNADANPFFKKVWDSQRAWAEVSIPFWARAQKANAAMGGAYADSLKKAAKPAAAAPAKADAKAPAKK